MMTSVKFSKKTGKTQTGQDFLIERVSSRKPNPLTRRELLNQVARLYDPTALVTHVKQVGHVLVRKAFQETLSLVDDMLNCGSSLPAPIVALSPEGAMIYQRYYLFSVTLYDTEYNGSSYGYPNNIFNQWAELKFTYF